MRKAERGACLENIVIWKSDLETKIKLLTLFGKYKTRVMNMRKKEEVRQRKMKSEVTFYLMGHSIIQSHEKIQQVANKDIYLEF